jgi:hypothetical protein
MVGDTWDRQSARDRMLDELMANIVRKLHSDQVQNHEFMVRLEARAPLTSSSMRVAVVSCEEPVAGLIGSPSDVLFFQRVDTAEAIRPRLAKWIDARAPTALA